MSVTLALAYPAPPPLCYRGRFWRLNSSTRRLGTESPTAWAAIAGRLPGRLATVSSFVTLLNSC